MDSRLYELALGSDVDGLTDKEVEAELDDMPDNDDGVNVTIREGIKPNIAPPTPKVSLVAVSYNNNKPPRDTLQPKPKHMVT